MPIFDVSSTEEMASTESEIVSETNVSAVTDENAELDRMKSMPKPMIKALPMGPGPVPIAPSIKPTVPVIQPLPSPDTEQLEEEAATLVEESQKLAQALTYREKAEEITSEQISETEAVEEMPEVPEIDLELPSDEGFSDDISKLQELALQMEAEKRGNGE